MISRPLLTLSVALITVPVFAWNDFGHMTIAGIAERTLKPEVRVKVRELLKVGGTPKTNDLLTAACWADDTRNRENGPWHYINHHFRTDGKPTEMKPLEQNVVWAIQTFTAILKNPAAPEAERADALRYLLHYVGDIHQPLHCVARGTDQFPEGDRGGNEFKILPPKGFKPEPRNLHFLWDMGGGQFRDVERPLTPAGRDAISEVTELVIKLFPEERFGAEKSVTDPAKWALEGLTLAKKSVYNLKELEEPATSYLEECRRISLRQVALAGYRLADLLNRTLG